MILSHHTKARLFFTYLKDKTELFLYVKPHGTSGSEMIYRRSPSDTAMNLRIQAILDNAGIHKSETDIWILLYPPEIHTTTLYIPVHASRIEVKALIREQVFANVSYSVNYDWDNYSLLVRENGNGENMVTVTILGKDVLPRIKELLGENFGRVGFIGDGLQFLNVEANRYDALRGQPYEIILPYDELYYVASFRSGIHVESSALTHASSSSFGNYELMSQQVYLDIRHHKNFVNQPKIQPLAEHSEWRRARLTPAAFPTWYIARNSLQQTEPVSFSKQFEGKKTEEQKRKNSASKRGANHLLD